jgi:hypothetical protein
MIFNKTPHARFMNAGRQAEKVLPIQKPKAYEYGEHSYGEIL